MCVASRGGFGYKTEYHGNDDSRVFDGHETKELSNTKTYR